MDHSARFQSIFKREIKREGADKLLDFLFSKASDFETAPASTRFHGSYPGGLIEHSLNVYDCLTDYLAHDRVRNVFGMKVSGETAPHYLLLCDEDLQEDGRFKMNPPLRGREDREALRQAVADGTIEVIATDHAPHTAEQKSRGLAGSAMGIVGLECAFPLLYTYLVKPGLLTLEQLVERMSMAPRRIFGLGGGLQAGEPADLTVFDLDAEYEIDPETFLSKGRATPFAGWRVAGRTLWTLVGGRTAYATERFR